MAAIGSDKVPHYDVVVVGGGFSGMYAVYSLRKIGLTVKAFEEGSDLGGVWYWNRYPGARVDSELPYYQLSIPEVWRHWTWTSRYPDHKELRKYIAHLDKTLDLRKDFEFDARVVDVQYSSGKNHWTVKTINNLTATSKYLFLASGLLHRGHTPEFPGLEDYKGIVHHSRHWPEDTSVKGMKVAIIGAGATGVQIVQELAKEADQLSVFMRRPSYCIPMGQRNFSSEEQEYFKAYYDVLFQAGRESRNGFPIQNPGINALDLSEEEREKILNYAYQRAGNTIGGWGFADTVTDKKANKIVYDYWRKVVHSRMKDSVKRELMAPKDPPYYFGTKRHPLENDYYECLDMPHVEIVDLKASPLISFTEKGIRTADGKERDFDMVVLATGYDSFTGSVTSMGLKNKDGVDMKDVWKDGIHTYLGMTISGFPNTFMIYSPQAPTAHSNGPTILEAQINFIVATIAKAEKEGVKTIEPLPAAEEEWDEEVQRSNDGTLFPYTDSWWNKGSIPGQKAQMLTYTGGIWQYAQIAHSKLEGWKGFTIVRDRDLHSKL